MTALVQGRTPIRPPPIAPMKSVDWRPGMAMTVQEVYNPAPLAANSTTTIIGGTCAFGGFLCTTAGTFSLQDSQNNVLIAPVPLAVGQFLVGGFVCANGAKVILSGGCAGTALYSASYS